MTRKPGEGWRLSLPAGLVKLLARPHSPLRSQAEAQLHLMRNLAAVEQEEPQLSPEGPCSTPTQGRASLVDSWTFLMALPTPPTSDQVTKVQSSVMVLTTGREK